MWPEKFPPNEMVHRSMSRYFDIVENKKNAKFLLAKKVPANFVDTDSLEALWQYHAKSTEAYFALESQIDNGKDLTSIATPEKSYSDLKILITYKMLEHCHFCVRRCGTNRLNNQTGFCGCGNTIAVSSIFAHVGEEPELVPSGTIFTIGCTMQCLHCQNWTISQWQEGSIEFTSQELAGEVEDLYSMGCRNVNLVGGEPTPWFGSWLETFRYVNVNVPVVWNSNAYYSPEIARLLAGFADVYLLDFKYGPGGCAERLSDAPNYWQVCTHNHLEAKRYGELIIRVLVLPGHLECCTKPILEWIAANLGVGTRVNLMFQYHPEWRANEVPELRRRLTGAEMERALQLAKAAGLVNLVA